MDSSYKTHPGTFLRLITISTAVLAVSCLPAEEALINNFPLDETPIDRSNTHMMNSYADVLAPAREAVVSVTTARIVEYMQRGSGVNPMEEFLRRFYGLPSPHAPQNQVPEEPQPQERRVPNGLGSGVIISADGYILTNNHVVTDERGEPVDEIKVHLADGSQIDAELIGRDPRTDIALIKIDRENLPYINMADSDNLRVGDIVFAIGNPLGIGLTSTMGIVSATGRTNLGILGTEGYENFIQTDAAINRGNSGGALVDSMGRLIGINTAIYSQTGGNIGIGFAIPISMARIVVLELIDNGEVRRGFLGITIQNLDAALAEAFSLASTKGALIEVVQEGGPADKAGLKRGDIILSINGKQIESVADLRLTVASIRPDSQVKIVVVRDGEEKTFEVEVGSQDALAAGFGSGGSPLEGVQFEPMTGELQREYNLRENRGLLVTSVDVRSPYAERLYRGMVILEVNDRPVNTLEDLRSTLVSGRVNKLWVSWRNNRGFIAIRVP